MDNFLGINFLIVNFALLIRLQVYIFWSFSTYAIYKLFKWFQVNFPLGNFS